MIERFLFPFGDIPKGSRVVIYGAGNVGKQFEKQIIGTNYCTIVKWVDKEWKYYAERGFLIGDICAISEVPYDYIIIAVRDKEVAEKIKETLRDNYSVSESKLFWKKYVCLDNAYSEPAVLISDACDKDELQYVEPELLLNSKAMEHMVRYLLAKDFKNHIYNQKHLSLYQRLIMTSTSAEEKLEGQVRLFSDYSQKKGLDNYIEMFKELVTSMESEGFIKSNYIPKGNNGYLANGKHRYASALALEKKIWVRAYETIEGHYKDIEWFRQNAFNDEDIIYILRAFCDLFKQCGIYLLYGPVYKYWDYLTDLIKKDLTVAGYVDLNFQNDYIGLSNLIRDNYGDTERNLMNIEEKIHFLLLAPLRVRVLIVTDENLSDKASFYSIMKWKKDELRKHMFMDTVKHTVIVHGSDSAEEFLHMKKIWLSSNNLKYARMRVLFDYSKVLVSRIENLRKYLFERHIPVDEICILGSAGMELFGLKCAEDLDFCVSSKYRESICEENLPENVHLKRPDTVYVDSDTVYTDDILINEPDFHYVFNDFKFINLDILYLMKKYRNLDKDKDDMRRLEVFFDSVKAFDEQSAFRSQMEREINRQFHV